MNTTYFGLLAEFEGKTNIPLESLSEQYFGMKPSAAKVQAGKGNLPVPAFRIGGQKTPWLVSISDLAELIDNRREYMKRNMVHQSL